MINYKFDKYLNLDLRLMQYVPSGIQSLSVGNGLTYDYNMRKSARWNRRLLKRQLLNNNEDMSRREAKNLATQNVGNYINTLGDRANSSDREWLEDRTSQYHLDDNGKLLRNKSNFWKGLAVAGSALAFTPIAGGAVAGAINWNKYDKWKPGLVTLPQEQTQENNQTYTPLNQYSMMDRYMKDPSKYLPSYGKSQFSSWNSSVIKPGSNISSDKPVTDDAVTPKPEFTYAGSKYDTKARHEGFNSREKVAELQRKIQRYYDPKYMETHQDSFDDGLWGDKTEEAYQAYKKKAQEELGSQPLARGKGNTQPTPSFNINTWHAGIGNSLLYTPGLTMNQLMQGYFDKYKEKLNGINPELAKNLGKNDLNFLRNLNGWMIHHNLGDTALEGVRAYNKNARIKNVGYSGYRPNMSIVFENSNLSKHYYGGQLNKFQTGGLIPELVQQAQSLDLQEQLAEMICRAAFVKIAEAAANQLQIAPKLAVEAVLKEAQSNPQKLKETLSSKEILQQAELFIALNAPLMIEVVKEKGWKGLYLAIMTLKAKQGTKLSYINSLKGICPEGYEMSYMKAGGKVCPVCKKKVKINKDCGGNAMKMHATGGISEMMNQIKTDLLACGGKMKKVKKDLDGGKAFSDKEMSDYGKLYYMAERKTKYPNASQALLEGKEPITVWRKDKNGKKFKFTGIFKNNSSNPFDLHPYTK